MKHEKNFIISCQIVNNALIINIILYIIYDVLDENYTSDDSYIVNGKCVTLSINIALSYLM